MSEAQKPRSYTSILIGIIAGCCLSCALCAGIGFFFGNIIIASGAFSLSELNDNAPAWLPVPILLAVLILYGWGTVITFLGVTSRRMKATTTGKITESALASYYNSDEGGDVYYITSSVEYTAEGQPYRNEGRHRFLSNDESEALTLLKSMRPGDPVTVIYDPMNPHSMTLDSPDIHPGGEILTGLGLIGGGLALSLLLGVTLTRFF